ncbi:hypothetical protein Q9L42_000190 (plasmid) [Methylomarinum sp. Ch1-1]|uniref:Integrase n=1 Tax=Methylomarinum roseum TaxID=3067653 RepID=A0AAU7NP58_9GAMM|nr:hypothetical protein [Methylomarinum sp. Ch1-1]MDP4523130.1 hypothetical protein [Methylomarinum sp. Ch1-1]
MDDNELQKAREEAIAADKCFSKGRLRDEFRMKPKPDAIPIKFYKNDYGRKYGVYRIADCVPIRTIQRREPTEKQKRAREALALTRIFHQPQKAAPTSKLILENR